MAYVSGSRWLVDVCKFVCCFFFLGVYSEGGEVSGCCPCVGGGGVCVCGGFVAIGRGGMAGEFSLLGGGVVTGGWC